METRLDVLETMKGGLFDLDGVIVDTAKYHYLAWKRLASELGSDFSETDNERLKGVSRMASLEIVLEIVGKSLSATDKLALADRKNGWYVEYISRMGQDELLPGAREYLTRLKERGVKIALGSASKNAPMILSNLAIVDLFDAVVDGNSVSKPKPDPEVFLKCAEQLGLAPADCVVFEDAVAGIKAARCAGMFAVGIGKREVLTEANFVVGGLCDLL
jgi:beta-phosphoglucomutase